MVSLWKLKDKQNETKISRFQKIDNLIFYRIIHKFNIKLKIVLRKFCFLLVHIKWHNLVILLTCTRMKWKEKNDLKSDTIHVSLDIFMEQMLSFFMIIILCRESLGEVRPRTVFVWYWMNYNFSIKKKTLIRFAELFTFVLGQTPKCIHSTFISRSLIFQL